MHDSWRKCFLCARNTARNAEKNKFHRGMANEMALEERNSSYNIGAACPDAKASNGPQRICPASLSHSLPLTVHAPGVARGHAYSFRQVSDKIAALLLLESFRVEKGVTHAVFPSLRWQIIQGSAQGIKCTRRVAQGIQ